MSTADLASLVHSQAETIAALQHQLDWFRRQLFGQKSERFAPDPDPMQMHLGEALPAPAPRGRRHYGEPPLAHAACPALDQPLGADLRGTVLIDPPKPREDHG